MANRQEAVADPDIQGVEREVFWAHAVGTIAGGIQLCRALRGQDVPLTDHAEAELIVAKQALEELLPTLPKE